MQYCRTHHDNVEAEFEERLDTGRLTRSKRKELGISVDELTTELGCRKREAITVRSSRSKTAGMLYAIRKYIKSQSANLGTYSQQGNDPVPISNITLVPQCPFSLLPLYLQCS